MIVCRGTGLSKTAELEELLEHMGTQIIKRVCLKFK